MALLSYDAQPNQLVLRGSFTRPRHASTCAGSTDCSASTSTTRASPSTAAGTRRRSSTLPHLGWLAVDAKDDSMPYIAAMPRLRFLGARIPSAGDDGFVALSKSRSIEYIWGRRCHNLRRRGFAALATCPRCAACR